MRSPFSFEGKLRPLPYAAWSLGAFLSQHLGVYAAFKVLGWQLDLNWRFFVVPLRSLAMFHGASDVILISGLAYFLAVAWLLAALAFRRAADANISEWIAGAAIAPFVQAPVILVLCFLRSRDRILPQPAADSVSWVAAAQGLLAGVGLTVAAVAVGALVFGAYGYGLFVVSPFLIGVTTASLANRKRDLGRERTAQLVLCATLLGGVALVGAALEGIVCIALASPLGFGVALIGGLLGRSIARRGKGSAKQTLSGIAILPIVFASEILFPATIVFDTSETVEVNAPPEVVWRSIVYMDAMDGPPAIPFRLGVAYPLGAKITGEGVGAVRLGEFSTGTAEERVTEWIPNRRLALTVLTDVPAMRELSPYAHVHAPHVAGYFRTTAMSFDLVPRPDGHTEIVEHTVHELRLDPVLYWLPIARWAVHENNARVLSHIKHQAERGAEPRG